MKVTTVPAAEVIDPLPAPGGGSPVDFQGVVVVAVDGDIDLHTGPDLRRVLTDLMAAAVADSSGLRSSTTLPGCADEGGSPASIWAVVVDLTAVEFIDSHAVGVLVQGHHLARRSGRAYALVGTHPMMHKLFEVTGLWKVLPLHRDVATAVASLLAAARPADAATTTPAPSTGDAPG